MTSALNMTSPRTKPWNLTSTAAGDVEANQRPLALHAAAPALVGGCSRQVPSYFGVRPCARPPGDPRRAAPASRSSSRLAAGQQLVGIRRGRGGAARTADTGRAVRRRPAPRPSRGPASADRRGCSAPTRASIVGSVSSMRRRNVPPCVREQPVEQRRPGVAEWRWPVGLGANRTRIVPLPGREARSASGAEQCGRVRRDRLAAADLAHALVRLTFDAHTARIDPPVRPPGSASGCRRGAAPTLCCSRITTTSTFCTSQPSCPRTSAAVFTAAASTLDASFQRGSVSG